jgi:hypothetical protein
VRANDNPETPDTFPYLFYLSDDWGLWRIVAASFQLAVFFSGKL